MNSHAISAGSLNTRATLAATVVWFLLFILLSILFLRPLVPGDIWFLLATGAETLANWRVPQEEFFIYTAIGSPELYGGWGFGVLMELAHRLAGLRGISALNAMLWSITFILGLMAARVRCNRKILQQISIAEFIAILFTVLAIIQLVMGRSWFRPEVTLFLFWNLSVLLFELDRSNNTSRSLFWFPIIIWAESLFHTAGTLMLLIPLAYGLERLHVHTKTRGIGLAMWQKRGLCLWMASFSASLLLPIFNPNGVSQIYFHVALFFRNFLENLSILPFGREIFHDGQPIGTGQNPEFMPVWSHPSSLALYKSAAAYSIVIFLADHRRIFFLLLAFPTAVIAVLHARGIGLWGLTLMVPCAAIAITISDSLRRIKMDKRFYKILPLTMCLLLIFAITYAARSGGMARMPISTPPYYFGLSALQAEYPKGANIFTTLSAGSIIPALLGRGYFVANSGHTMFVNLRRMSHIETVYEAKQGWQHELDKFGVVAVMGEPCESMHGRKIPIFEAIAASDAWRLSAVDAEGLTYVREHTALSDEDRRRKTQDTKTYWIRLRRCALEADQSRSYFASNSIKQAEHIIGTLK